MVGHALGEATGRTQKRAKNDVSDRQVVVLGSGNLGLVYLMEEKRRLTLEEIDERHPALLPALREHPDIGFLLVRSAEHGAVVLGPRGTRYLADDRLVGEDPLTPFSPTAAQHLRRTDGFEHVADIMVNSYYNPQLEEGCAFEELISFHGGMGGPQTRAFILHPTELPAPAEPIIGAAAVHTLLSGWRRFLEGDEADDEQAQPRYRLGWWADERTRSRCCRGAARRRVAHPQIRGDRRLDRRRRRRRRDPATGRSRRDRVVQEPLGPDQGGPGQVHRRGPDLPGRADRSGRSVVLRDPRRRLSEAGRREADRHRLRRRRRDEQLPPGQHRHVRDAVDVRRTHPGVHARRLDRGVPRTEDLLHDRRHLRLPLSLPVRAGVVRREPRQHLGASGLDDRDRRRRRFPDRPRRADLLAAGQEAVGAGPRGWRHPQPAEAVHDAGLPAVLPLLRGQVRGDRHLSRRVRDSGDLRVDHVDRRLGVAGERRVIHPRVGRRDPGDERAGAGRVLQRAEEHRGRVLHGATADHDRVERPLRDGARDLGLRLVGRENTRRELLRRGQGAGRRASGRAKAEAGEKKAERRRRSRRPTTKTKAPYSRCNECRRKGSRGTCRTGPDHRCRSPRRPRIPDRDRRLSSGGSSAIRSSMQRRSREPRRI